MSEAVKKGLIWGLGITALGVGIYLLYKKFGKTEEEESYVAEEDGGGEDLSHTPSASEIKKSTNANKWLKRGMKDGASSDEIAKLQYILNQIRISVRKVNWERTYAAETAQKAWFHNISTKQPILKIDGDFGSNTEKAVKIVMGRPDTSLCQVRRKRIEITKQIGFSNPYAKWGTVCGKY